MKLMIINERDKRTGRITPLGAVETEDEAAMCINESKNRIKAYNGNVEDYEWSVGEIEYNPNLTIMQKFVAYQFAKQILEGSTDVGVDTVKGLFTEQEMGEFNYWTKRLERGE